MSVLEPKVDSPPPNLEWRSSDASTLVSMPGGLADRIAGYVTEAYKSIPRRGAEAGGLLLGGVRLGPVIEIFITGFEPVPCDYRSGPSFTMSDSVQAEFQTAMARHPAAEILGFYRSHTRKVAGLEASDQEIVDRVFPGLSGLVLLIKPSGISVLNARYFFFQTGRLEVRPVGPEFPFLVSIPGGTPPPAVAEPEAETHAREPVFAEMVQESLALQDHAPSQAPVHSPPHTPVHSPPQTPLHTTPYVHSAPPPAEVEPGTLGGTETGKRRKRLQWELVAAGLMIAAALALLWWQYRGASGEGEVAASQAGPSHVASLGLAVHPGDGGWRITWNPASAAARDSVRGALDVTEDASHERIPLSASQVRGGATTYRPIGDDITFRLDLIARDNSLSTETYRVLLKPRDGEPPVLSSRSARPAPQPEKPVPERPAKPAPKPEKAPPKPEKAPPKPETAEEPGYVESTVASRVAPEVPDGIRPRITAPVPIDIRVSINREGRVTKATALQRDDGLVSYLAKRAVAAAKQWTFVPARRGGRPVESTRTIHFVFEQ